RKKEALSKMESTKQNLLRIRDILNEIQIQLSVLEKQVKRLNRYRKIKDEIKEIDLLLSSRKLQALTETESKLSHELTALKDEELRITAQKESGEALLEENRLLLTESNHVINELQQALYEIKNKISGEESRLEYNKKELHNTAELNGKYTLKLEELNSELSGLNAEIAERQCEVDAITAEIESLQQEYIRSAEQTASMKTRLGALHETIEKEKSEIIDIVTTRSQIKNAMQLNLNLQREVTQRLNKLEAEKDSCQDKLKEVEEKSAHLDQQMQEVTQLRTGKETAIEEYKKRIDTLSSDLQEKDVALHDLKEKTGIVRSRLISLKELQQNYEGFDDGVRTIMKKAENPVPDGRGIIALFADIIETAPEYETAVEAVLGRRLQSIIVQNHQTCIESIDYLKQHTGGRVSFIPLSIRCNRFRQPENELPEEHIVPLAQAVRTEPQYQQLVDTLFGDVFLVETISQGLTLWENVPSVCTFVTMEGEIIEPQGVVTSGGRSIANSGILQRNREIKQLSAELAELEDQVQALNDERERIASELSHITGIRETVNREKHELDIRFTQQDTYNRQLLEETRQCREKIELVKVETEGYAADLQKYQRELKELIIQEGSYKCSDDERQQALKGMQNTEIVLQEEVKKAESLAVELRVKLEVAQQKQGSAAENLNSLLAARVSSRSRIDSLLQEIDELKKRQESLSRDIQQAEETLYTLLNRNQERETQIVAEKEKAKTLEDTVAACEETLRKCRELRDEIEPRMHAIDLDLKEISLRFEHLSQELADKYSCTVHELPPPPDPEHFIQEEYQERLEKLKARLDNMGEVNLAAATEYDEHKKRFDFLHEQEQDLTQSLESLQKVIAKINRTTREKFQDTFDQVNRHFQEVFPVLFNGGKAYLSLTDETDLLETGIEIFVQPPGKKLQNLDLLSGGERSLTVVALLFAIFLTKPSPFCLLDEIDAALDDSNIDRFNQHLQKMSDRSQFIMVTHSKQSMQAANTLYGITMQERGVSKIVSVEMH
ncbi:MAG: chromosome segregation protein SMC, partial [Proteobacteria bacterium]|nr:chromosome segregation protein SMC [Pseudomonadota bacterium]